MTYRTILCLEKYCLELDVNIRKKHLILTGIDETPAQSNYGKTRPVDDEGNEMETEDSGYNPTLSIVFDTLHAIHDTLLIEDLDVAYRLGKKGPNPRPVLVKFAKECVRNEVNRKRFNMKDSDESKNIFMNEDLPSKVNAYRADLRCLVAHAKSKSINAKILGNKISIDNKIYRHKDIDKLPEGLRLSDAKMIDTTKGIAFQSHHAFLSNFFPCTVNYNGIKFKSAEHAYQYSRATFLGKTITANDVLKANKAEEAKRAVLNLQNSKEWDASKQKIMKDIVFAKFAQNHDLQNKLLATGERPLLEATYDSYWGCGLPLTARKLKQGEWHGKNYLGIILAECRFEIKREIALRDYQQDLSTNMNATQSPQISGLHALAKQQTKGRSTSSKQSSNQRSNKGLFSQSSSHGYQSQASNTQPMQSFQS